MDEVLDWIKAHPWQVGAFFSGVLLLLGVLRLLVRVEFRAHKTSIEQTSDEVTSKLLQILQAETDQHRNALRTEVQNLRSELRREQENARARLQNDHVKHVEELKTEALSAMREMLVVARRDGIPIEVRVASKKEADLIRETIGPVPIKVTTKKESPIVRPDNSGLSALERLAKEDL